MVPADALYSDDGTRGGMVGIAPVNPERLPGELPEGLQFPIVITVQTDGATNFDQPVPVCFPNLPDPVTGEVLPPGAKSALWSFNHDTGEFEIAGPMTVSEDGTLICTDPGVGIRAPGWHGTRPGVAIVDGRIVIFDPRTGEILAILEPPNGEGENPTDPINLFSGEFYESVEDLRIKGRGSDFVWTRKYRSQIGPNTAQGNGWDCSYNIFITEMGDDILVHDGNTRADLYRLQPNGTWTRDEFFQELRENTDDSYTLTFEDTGQWNFNPFDNSPSAGKIRSIVDRNGNTLSFEYDAQGRLAKITDTLDRDIDISYNSDNFIERITDFAGRVVRYEYYNGVEPGGNFGDLKSVTSPAVTGTPNGNDFPNGKTTTYTYSTDFADNRLNGNLLTITDGRRNHPNDPTFGTGPYLVNIYAATTDPDDPNFDRVVQQIWGGDTLDFVYVPALPSEANGGTVTKTIVNDRNGNVKEYFYDAGNRMVRRREYTGRAIPNQLTTEISNRPTGKLRTTDPDFFETQYEWNADSLLKRIIHPNGNITESVYELDINLNAPPRSRGNLRILRSRPGTHLPVGDQNVIEAFYEYEPIFNFVSKHTDGRGNTTFSTYDDRGNLIRIQNRIPSIIEEFEYNELGQLTAQSLPDNGSNHRRRDEFAYYENGPQRGYLHQAVADARNFALTTTYEYDLVGNLIKTTDPRGHDKQLVVNTLDQVVQEISREVIDGSGIHYQKDFSYDANNNLVQIDIQNINDEGVLQANTHFTTTYDYEILNRVTRKTEEVDVDHFIVTEYEYDGNRNLTRTLYGEATNGNQPTNVVRMIYDERDLLFLDIQAEGDPDQSTTEYNYDPNQNPTRVREGIENLPRVTLNTYDAYNRFVLKNDSMGNVTEYHYDSNHNLVSLRIEGELIDIEGGAANIRLEEWAYSFDAMDRIIQSTKFFFDTESQSPIADGESIHLVEYSDSSQVLRVVNDNGHQATTTYDTANRQSVVTDHKGNRIFYTYDANSNLVAKREVDQSDLGNLDETFTFTYAYDNLNRLIRMIDSVSNVNEAAYDSRNNLTLSIDALRIAPDAPGNVVRFEFDGLNRLTTTTRFLTRDGAGTGESAGTIVTTQVWDDSSRPTQMTDDNGNTTVYEYDALDRPVSITYADGTVFSTNYDVHSNATTMADANGNVISCTYDLLNRLTRKDIKPGAEISDETTFEIYQYDGLSRIVHAEDDDSLVTRRYDSLSQVTKEIQNGQMITSLYDGVGNMLVCTYPGGREISQVFDELERIKVISDQAGMIGTYDYVGFRRVARRDYGNGTRMEYVYDGIVDTPNPVNDFGLKRPIRTIHSNTAGGTVFDERSYTWDQMGNKTSHTDVLPGGLSRSYSYDSVYRMIRSTQIRPGVLTETISYALDGVGNRIDVTGGERPGGYVMDTTSPDPADLQLNQYTATSFDERDYDEKGNLVSIDNGLPAEAGFKYDYHDQVISYIDFGTNVTASYAYDTFGRRIEKTVADGNTQETTRYFYTGWRVCEEQDGAGTTQATYVYGRYIDEVLNMQRGGSDFYYHTDDLFNVMKVTDGLGDIAESYEYEAYGEPSFFSQSASPLPQSAIGNPYLFHGRRYDPETGFFYFRNRYYDPLVGRFLQRDAINDPVNLGNLYTFVGNNPWSDADPYAQAQGDWWDPRSYDWGVFAEEFGEGLWNVASLGTRARIKRNHEMGITGLGQDISAAAGAVLNTISFGISDNVADRMLVEGQGFGEALIKGTGDALYNLTPIDELRQLTLNWHKLSGWERAELINSAIGKTAGLILAGKALRSKGGGPKTGCFAPGTLILMADGSTKPIEEIERGDLILSDDPNDEIGPEPRIVIEKFQNYTFRLIYIGIDSDGDGIVDGKFQATGEHPIWTQNRGWRNAEDLVKGDVFQDYNSGSVAVVSVASKTNSSDTYNLEVEGMHTFFIAVNGTSVLVHNKTTYITYTAPELDVTGNPTGRTYVGKATGQGTPQEVLNRRFSGQNHHPGHELGQPSLDKVHNTKNQMRGREQLLYEKYATKGQAANKYNPVDKTNKKKWKRYKRASIRKHGKSCP